jgi:hypothetical protein
LDHVVTDFLPCVLWVLMVTCYDTIVSNPYTHKTHTTYFHGRFIMSSEESRIVLKSMDSHFSGLESRITGLESRITGLESRMTGIESRIGGLETSMSHLATAVSQSLNGHNDS